MSLNKGGTDTAGLARWVPKLIVAESPAPAEAPSDGNAPPAEAAVPAAPVEPVPLPLPMPVMAEPEPAFAEPDPQLLDEARAEGYALGVADGRRQATQQAAREAGELQKMLAGLGQLRTDLEAALAEEVLSLSVAMARQIVRQSLKLYPEAIVPVLRDAMQVLPGLNHQTILHLHPDDAVLVRPALEQDPVLAQSTWKIVEDGRLERGGCRLETPESEVDATLPVRWARVLAALGREDSWQAPA